MVDRFVAVGQCFGICCLMLLGFLLTVVIVLQIYLAFLNVLSEINSLTWVEVERKFRSPVK